MIFHRNMIALRDRKTTQKMTSLFATDMKERPDILGLRYISDFVPPNEEADILLKIDAQPWLENFKRRVQHYGYRYDYKAQALNSGSYLGPMPDWLSSLCIKLYKRGVFHAPPDQVIINEYLPGQGISAHIDCVPCFAGIIASLSLGSSCTMGFSLPKTHQEKSLILEERSLIVMSGAARYEWQHAIPARKSDVINGIKTKRARRVSLTFRNVLLG